MSNRTVVNRSTYEKESQELFQLWGKLLNQRPSIVQKFYEGWYEIIVRELYTGGFVYLPKMGWIMLQNKKNSVQKQIQPDGTYKYYEVPSRDIPIFRPEDDFVSDVNMKGITQSWRWRQKQGKPSLRDKEREKRAAELLELDYQEVDTIPLTPKIKTIMRKSEFKEKLQELRKKYEEQLFNAINEVRDSGETNE